MNLTDRIKGAWFAFRNGNKQPEFTEPQNHTTYVYPSYTRPSRHRLSYGVEKSILAGIYSKMAIDASQVDIRHVILDEKENYIAMYPDAIDFRLHFSANIDQTSTAFIQDLILSMFDEGCVAVVPVLMEDEPNEDGICDIYSLRVAKITKWYPKHVEVECYNEDHQKDEKVLLSKNDVCIIENPFYTVMNEPNSIYSVTIHD